MNDDNLNEIFSPQPVDPELLGRIEKSIASSIKPVRPMMPEWMLVSGLMLACVAIGVTFAALSGFMGIERLSVVQIVSIFGALAVLIFLAATISARAMVPGSRRIASSPALALVGCVALTSIFTLLFPDHTITNFVPRGLNCLRAGLLTAIPTAAAAWLILRRGFAVNKLDAALASGLVAGLSGLLMLELHCPNFQVMHVMIWHTAVFPLSGFAVVILVQLFGKKRKAAEFMQ